MGAASEIEPSQKVAQHEDAVDEWEAAPDDASLIILTALWERLQENGKSLEHYISGLCQRGI